MKNNKQGFSLVELAIGLAVITILILAVSFSSGIRDNARIQSAASSIQALRSAAENYLISAGTLDYSALNIDKLKTSNLLPTNFDATKSNPWGGSFTIGPNTDKTRFDIALGGITQSQATKLTTFFQNTSTSSYDATKTTWTISF